MSKIHLKKESLLLISLLVVTIDQVSKGLARNNLVEGSKASFLPHLLNFRLVKNSGAAFSLFSNSTTFLALLSLIVSIVLLIWLWKNSPIVFWKGMGIAFLLGGSIGNGWDRWRYSYVTDFLELIPISFPIFNFADIAINIAVIFFIIEWFFNQNAKQ